MKQTITAVSPERLPSSPALLPCQLWPTGVWLLCDHINIQPGHKARAAWDQCHRPAATSTCARTEDSLGTGAPLGSGTPASSSRTFVGPVGRRTWAAAWLGTGSQKLVAKEVSARPGWPSCRRLQSTRERQRADAGQTTDFCALFFLSATALGRIKGDRAQSDTAASAGTEAWRPGRCTKAAPGKPGQFCLNRL